MRGRVFVCDFARVRARVSPVFVCVACTFLIRVRGRMRGQSVKADREQAT